MIVGGYSLHLYCDDPNCSNGEHGSLSMGEFDANNERETRKQARRRGWSFKQTPDGEKCYCKGCKS